MTSQGIEPRQIAAARALRKMNRGTARTEELADMDLKAALQRHAQPRATPEHATPSASAPKAPMVRANARGEEGSDAPSPAAGSKKKYSVAGTRRPYVIVYGEELEFLNRYGVDHSEDRFKDDYLKFIQDDTSKLGINTLSQESTRHLQE